MKYIITIGRQYGSGGRYIAKEVARRLRIPYYDDELLQIVAKETDWNIDYLKMYDEKHDSIFSFYGLLNNELTASQKVSLAEFSTIRKICKSESCVIVGRCADYVLKDYENVLNVFIYASLDKRIHRALKYFDIDEKYVEEELIKKDRSRAKYYNSYTDQKWGSVENYDLCLKSDIGIKKTVDVIVEYAKKKFRL